jgi:hypothetical protein
VKTPEKKSSSRRASRTPTHHNPVQLADGGAAAIKTGKEYASFAGMSVAGFSATGTGPLINMMPVIGQRGHPAVDQMMTDDTLGTCIEIKKRAALSTPWSWEAASDDPEHQKDQQYLTRVFDRLDSAEQDENGVNVGVVNKLRDILSKIEHGYSVTNILFDVMEDGDFAGSYGLADLKTKPPHFFTFETDQFLNLKPDGIIHNYTDKLPVDQFLVATHDPRFNNVYGYSECIRAYEPWNYKKMFQRMRAVRLERFASGTLDAEENSQDPPSAGERANVDSLGRGMQAKSYIRHTDKIKISILEAASGTDDFAAAITDQNIQIARAVFFPDKMGFSAGDKAGGAYAMSKTHLDTWVQIVTSLQRDLAVQMKRLGRKLIVASFGVRDKYPNFVFGDMTEEQVGAFVTQVVQLTTAGYLDPLDTTVRKKVRELMEFPEEEDATVEQMRKERDAKRKSMNQKQTDPNADPNADPQAGGDTQNFAEDDGRVSDGGIDCDSLDGRLFAAADPETTITAAIAAIQAAPGGVVIVGGPKSGKSTIASVAAERFKIRARYGDNLIGQMGWSAMSDTVAEWFDAPGKWIVEGVVTVRAIRKWLSFHPDETPPFTIIVLSGSIQKRSPGQSAMAAGVTTIWNEIQPELEARGATVVMV